MIASKHVRLVLVPLVFFLCTFVASCGGGGGGGGGGGDGGGDGGGETLGVYDFGLSLLADHPLTLSAILDSQPVTATLEKIFEGETFNGTYDIDSEIITMGSKGSIFVKVTTTGMWNPPLNLLTIVIDQEPVVMPVGESPTQGKIRVGVGISPNFTYTFTVTITATGVLLEREGFVPVEYTWDEFDELLGSAAPDWQQQASFASIIIGFIFDQLTFDINTITQIEENDTTLSKGNVTINGDTFPGTPPAGHDAKGTLVLSSTDGNVGPGGDFSEVFHDYWVDDPLDDIDQLYDGSVNFVGFLRNSDDARDVITAIGFIPNGPDDPGGVFFDEDGLTIYETEETSPGVFSIDDAATLIITGGYSIQFFESTP
jgi:hypothetical protein